MKKSDFKIFDLKAESCFWLLKSESQRLVVSLRKEVDRTMEMSKFLFLELWGLVAAATGTEEIKWENDKKFRI